MLSGVLMIRLGLCSGACITRNTQGVIDAALAAGLDAVEWAQDVHLGLGDLRAAEELMMTTLSAGLTTASYATLYRAGAADEGFKRFDELLAVAAILQAPILRIYACSERQSDANEKHKSDLAAELKRLGERTAKKGITLCLSLGRGTGFSSYARALSLVAEAGHAFVRLAWEDLPYARPDEATAALESSKAKVGLVLARSAGRDGKPRSIAEDLDSWRARLSSFKSAELDPKMGSFLLLGAQRAEGEDGVTALAADAAALRGLVSELEPQKKR
jgi:hypothetical protein